MTCLEFCAREGKHFYFSRRQSTFPAARILCRNKDAILAQNLDSNDYQILSSCCFSESQYWIGLAESPNCHQNMSYQWMEDSSTCTDGKPLTIKRKPNNGKCQAIALTLTPTYQRFVRANEVDCALGKRFICQLSSKSLTSSSFMLKPSVPTTTNEQSTHWPLIAGAIGSFALLIVILSVCFSVRRKKAKRTSKKLHQHSQAALSHSHETTKHEEEPTYCSIIDDLESISALQESRPSHNRVLQSAEPGYDTPAVKMLSQTFAVEDNRQEEDSDYAQTYEHLHVPQEKKINYCMLDWQEPDYIQPSN